MDGIYEKAHKMTKKICTKYKDIDYKTEKKLLFKREGNLVKELEFRSSDMFDPMIFNLKDIIDTNFLKDDTIKIYYAETGGEYSNKNLIYIGSLVVKEDIKQNDLTKENQEKRKFNYLFIILLLPIIAALITLRKKKKSSMLTRSMMKPPKVLS